MRKERVNLQTFSVINISARLSCFVFNYKHFQSGCRNYGRVEFLPRHNGNTIKPYILKPARSAEGSPTRPLEHR